MSEPSAVADGLTSYSFDNISIAQHQCFSTKVSIAQLKPPATAGGSDKLHQTSVQSKITLPLFSSRILQSLCLSPDFTTKVEGFQQKPLNRGQGRLSFRETVLQLPPFARYFHELCRGRNRQTFALARVFLRVR